MYPDNKMCIQRYFDICSELTLDMFRMVQTLEAEKIESRSAYDRERRALEGEIAGLRRMIEKAGGKAMSPKISHEISTAVDNDWERMYYETINSTSWKVTRPLRVGIRALRRMRKS